MTIKSFLQTTGLVMAGVLPWLFASAIQNRSILTGTWISRHIDVIPISTTAVFGLVFSLWANMRFKMMGVLRRRRLLFISNMLAVFLGLDVYEFLAFASGSESQSANVLRSVIFAFTVLCCALLIRTGVYALKSRNKDVH
jgi:hypothetical protein